MNQNHPEEEGSQKYVTEHVHITYIVKDRIGMRSERMKSKFKTLPDWLENICENVEPKKTIQDFVFNWHFIEPPGEYFLYLCGENTYSKKLNHYVTKTEFEPKNKFFKIPRDIHKNLTHEQFKDWLTTQLKNFTKSDKFRTSYLTKGNKVSLGYSGGVIWTK